MAPPAFAGTITSPTPTTCTENTTSGCIFPPNLPSGEPAGAFPQDIGSFTITFSGFPANTLVSAEQCDGNPPTAPGYAPDIDCDPTTEPAQIKASTSGTGTFPAYDPNFGFYPFRGDSPQSQFTCLSPNEPVPAGTIDPVWRNCQLKLTTNDSQVNPGDAFETMQLPEPVANVPETPYAVLLPIGAVLLLGAGFGVTRIRRLRTAQ
jgi:hypothetical protein